MLIIILNFIINCYAFFLLLFREYQTNLEFKPLRDSEVVEDHQITVCVRKRPLNKKGIVLIFIVGDP